MCSWRLGNPYPICKYSGKLGPKIAQGDYQAPEGFYDITPDQMNPQSSEYLSFNIGFPNAFDQSLGRTGSFLMVHGGCRSVGCYAMTDYGIEERVFPSHGRGRRFNPYSAHHTLALQIKVFFAFSLASRSATRRRTSQEHAPHRRGKYGEFVHGRFCGLVGRAARVWLGRPGRRG